MEFVVDLMYLLYQKGLLFGRNYCTRPAKIRNPKNKIFFDKHIYSIIIHFYRHLVNNERFRVLVNKTYKLK